MAKDILIAATVKNVPNSQIDLPQLEPDKVVSGGFNVAFFVAGALAGIMIIVSGIMYMTAGGLPSGSSLFSSPGCYSWRCYHWSSVSRLLLTVSQIRPVPAAPVLSIAPVPLAKI